MDIRFTGAIVFWQATVIGLALAAVAWWFYQREVKTATAKIARVLPVLRAITVFLVVMMLAGSVLHLRTVIGQVSRLILLVDGSQSMALTDAQMEPARKLLELEHRGLLPPGTLDTHLATASDKLAKVSQLANQALGNSANPIDAQFPAANNPGQTVQQITDLLTGALSDLQAARLMQFNASVMQPGQLFVERWNGIPGDQVSILTSSRKYKNAPDAVSTINAFETGLGGDNYGLRVSGFLIPPVSGNYTFYIMSDDGSELWLSSDDRPDNKERICFSEGFSGDWNANPSQTSAAIELVAGRKYYVEAFLKQGNGGVYLRVGWKRPDGADERPIPRAYLVGFQPSQTSDKLLADLTQKIRDDLLKSVGALAQLKDDERQTKTRAGLTQLAAQVMLYQQQVDVLFDSYAAQLESAKDPRIQPVVDQFNSQTRWQRVQSFLLDGKQSLIGQLTGKHDIEVWTVTNDGPQRLWSSRQTREPPTELAAQPDGYMTDLSGPVDAAVKGLDDKRVKTTMVLFSDGRENHGTTVSDTAKILGRRNITIDTVGMGAMQPPPDLAVMNVDAPTTIYFKDRLSGTVTLNDDMPAGKPFTLKIEHQGRLLWQKDMRTQGNGRRSVDFDFSIEDVTQQMVAMQDKDVTHSAMPVGLTISAGPIDGELLTDNNTSDLLVQAATRQRKVLLLDGRPRWDFRYLRNALKRDNQWEVNALSGLVDRAEKPWPRGDGEDTFPRDRQALFSYDLVVMGDVPRDWLRPDEMQWLREFVSQRAGGMIFMDGGRRRLAEYADTPLGELFPVQWKSNTIGDTNNPQRLRLTGTGQSISALDLAGEGRDNPQLWGELKPPHWVAPVTALPGSQIFAEAVFPGGAVPVIVERNYGAGKVVYLGMDETWRWRYNVADRYFDRFWGQLVNWSMDRVYSASDRFIALDVGQSTYNLNEQVDVVVRIHDINGKPLAKADAQAILWRNGVRFASVDLTADESENGIYRGRTGKLPAGKYEVSVKVAQLPDAQVKARAQFLVQPKTSAEMSELTCNQPLLRQAAENAGGVYFGEQDITKLAEHLQSMSKTKIIEKDLSLWDNWYWLIPILVLLTLEWIIRKRAGLM